MNEDSAQGRRQMWSACPILERTGDNQPVGRCWFHCPKDVCPRHGDVSGPLAVYRRSGQLTDENNWSRVTPGKDAPA